MIVPALRLTFALLVALALPLIAPADAPPATPPAAELYPLATKHLTAGKWYEDSAAQLRAAIQQQPGDMSYHSALGCALADRAASLACAALWTKALAGERAQYSRDLARWKAAQRDPKNAQFGAPRPAAPPRILMHTNDDRKPFHLTEAEAMARIADLSKEAAAEWARSVALATDPKTKAEMEDVQGWGLRLLCRAAKTEIGGQTLTLPLKNQPTESDAVKAFEAVVKDDPDSALYWQALGDAASALGADDTHAMQAVDAYRRSLALQAGNTPLWYRLAQLTAKSDAPGAIAALKTAGDADTANAYPRYQLAALIIAQAHFGDVLAQASGKEGASAAVEFANAAAPGEDDQKVAQQAIAAIESGNAAAEYRLPAYAPPVPALLLQAWHYSVESDSAEADGSAALRGLTRSVCGYAEAAAGQHDFTEAARAANAGMGVGLKMMGRWPLADATPGSDDVATALAGASLVETGATTLEHVYQQSGDTFRAVQTQAQYDDFRRQLQIYRQALAQIRASHDDRAY